MTIRKFNGRPSPELVSNTDEQGVYDLLDRLDVQYITLVHPAASTMEQCETIRNSIGAPVFKNLFLTNKQQTQFYLLMMPADKPFKTKYLSSQLGCARLSFATPGHMMELLHIRPGAVSPMGLIYDSGMRVRLIIDDELRDSGLYACHPCVNTASISLSLDSLLRSILPATGHFYTWVTLPREKNCDNE